MQWLNNLNIRPKLMVLSGISLILTMAVGGFAIWRMSAVNAEGLKIAEINLPTVRLAGEMATATRRVQSLQFQHISANSDSAMADIEQRIEAAKADLDSARKAYEALPSTGEELASYKRMGESWSRYLATWPGIAALSRDKKPAEAGDALLAQVNEYRTMDAEQQTVIRLNAGYAKSASEQANRIYTQARTYVIIATIFAGAIGALLALMVSGRIAATVRILADRTLMLRGNCIARTREALVAMSAGDLSVSATPTTQLLHSKDKDEIGDIARAVDAIIVDIQATIAAFTTTQSTLRHVMGETQMLVTAARDGDLAKRADAESLQGAFRQLVEGMNGTLAAVAAPIGEARTVLGQLAQRDLTGRMSGEYAGEYAEMQNSINQAIGNLEVTLTQVATASSQVASASGLITAGGQSLAAGSSQQAANLEEVSASVQEFAAAAKESAAKARDAQTIAIGARTDADEGTLHMQRLTDAVNEIKQSSSETAKIMKSIEEIAFQTNLLALNAAVEAARAGDAGRGFAVVADEVRALALRSAEASKTTATLIERGLASAERGVSLNVDVSSSFSRITERVGKVAEVMGGISTAAEQQASGVVQINSALEQLNAVTQQVAANAEESASAAEELSSQARSLNVTVAGFRLATPPVVAHAHPDGRERSRIPARQNRAARPGLVFAGAGAGSSPESDPDDDAFLGF